MLSTCWEIREAKLAEKIFIFWEPHPDADFFVDYDLINDITKKLMESTDWIDDF